MATLEEIAQQFEDALETDTGTTMAENTGLGKNELLPDVPKGVTAQSFYRTGVKSGLLPQGLATFTSSPFGSFQGRMGVAQGTKQDSATTTGQQSAAPAPVVAPLSAPQKQEQEWTSLDMEQMGLENLDPAIDPNYGITNVLKMMASPMATILEGAFGGSDPSSEESKGNPYYDFGTFTSDQIQEMIDNGQMNEAQASAYQAGIDRMDINGNAVNEKGQYYADLPKDSTDFVTRYASNTGVYWYSDNDKMYRDAEQKSINDSIFTKGLKRVESWTGLDFGGGGLRGSFTPGYQHNKDEGGRWEKGDFISAGGKVHHGGLKQDFLDLINSGKAGRKLAQEIISIRTISPDLQRALAKKIAEQPTVETTQGGEDGGEDSVDPSAGGGFGEDLGAGDIGSFYESGGQIAMQEGGEAPQMPQMPQEGQEAEMTNLGMVNEQAAPPQEGGQQSVKDDIPREADEGDYILPYETVLQVGLKQLNRYAKEAIQLAIKNNVNLKGTDLDPSDDVPIKISNYEYHIPKGLVPYFGGGKKYLDKIRNEGLALRKRLEEEKQPSMKEQQPMEAAPEPTPQPQMVADAQPAPQTPMMQTGGFVDDPVKALKSAEQALTSDTSQPTQSAYNQVQALEQARQKSQQPPMVDPTGKVVQQGFAAPQGFALGGNVETPIEEEENVQEEPLPQTQMETSAVQTPEPRETQIADASFNQAFKTASDAGERSFIHKGQKYSTIRKEDQDNFNRLKTLEIEKLMALTALGEARSENRAGMQAVMHVIRNRVNSKDPQFGINRFPNDPFRSVILHPNAFSALKGFELGNTKDEKHQKNFAKFMNVSIKDNAYRDAVEDARAIMNNEIDDITNGALYYYNPEVVERPKHLRGMERKTVIGKHHFYHQGGFVEKVGDTAA